MGMGTGIGDWKWYYNRDLVVLMALASVTPGGNGYDGATENPEPTTELQVISMHSLLHTFRDLVRKIYACLFAHALRLFHAYPSLSSLLNPSLFISHLLACMAPVRRLSSFQLSPAPKCMQWMLFVRIFTD